MILQNMKNKVKLQTLLLWALISILSISTTQAQGLQFYGNKTPIEQRTSYLVFNEKSMPTFRKHLEISFELSIQDFATFGYLFHITDPQTNAAYSFTYTYIDNRSGAFKFNTEGKTNHLAMTFVNDSIKSKWIPVKLYIDFATGQSTLSIAGRTAQSVSKMKAIAQLKPLLRFGRREHLHDVPSFAIRHLTVAGEKQSFSFLLDESQGEEVHNTKGNVQGQVSNPYWLINDSYHWTRSATVTSKTSIGSKFSDTQQALLFINQDSLFTYRVEQKQLLSKAYANKMPVKMLLGTTFINEAANKIYAYEINSLPIGDTTMAVLDVATLTWQPIGKAFTEVQLHHHNGFWDTKRNRYCIFGGFGNRQYSNKIIAYDALADRWDTLQFKGDKIPPRFFSSIAASPKGDQLYIYGGVGNESGDQSVGHNYFNDLYRIGLTSQTINKCWENGLEKKTVPAGRMILSADEQSFYAMRYAEYERNTHLQLYRISLADGKMEQLGDSIPFVSESIATNVALYYNQTLQEFYCVIQEFYNEDQHTQAIVYTLAAPPVDKATIERYSYNKENNKKCLFLILTGIAISGLFALFMFYHYNRRKNKDGEKNKDKEVFTAIESAPPTPKAPAHIVENRPSPKPEFNKVYIYGIFTVYGKSGRDVTHLFSNKLKHIFIYILLNSTKEGVNSSSLNDLFWPDKAEDKAKNLKGVTISNLRKALSEIEGMELIYEKGFFKIKVSEPCYCDYFCLHAHLPADAQAYDCLLPIWERGRLLESSKHELFDKYKQYSEDIIFSTLPQGLPEHYQKNESKHVLRICAILLKRDPLYEPALIYMMLTYTRLNEFEKRSKTYTAFITEYRNTMGEEYPQSMEALLQERL